MYIKKGVVPYLCRSAEPSLTGTGIVRLCHRIINDKIFNKQKKKDYEENDY